jgi:hypothetical protein
VGGIGHSLNYQLTVAGKFNAEEQKKSQRAAEEGSFTATKVGAASLPLTLGRQEKWQRLPAAV